MEALNYSKDSLFVLAGPRTSVARRWRCAARRTAVKARALGKIPNTTLIVCVGAVRRDATLITIMAKQCQFFSAIFSVHTPPRHTGGAALCSPISPGLASENEHAEHIGLSISAHSIHFSITLS